MVWSVLAAAFLATAPAAPKTQPPQPGAGLVILPPEVILQAPQPATRELVGQQLIVARVANGRFTGDATAGAGFRSSDARVATVSHDGTVRPVAPGRAVVTATVSGATTSVAVLVQPPNTPHRTPDTEHASPSFRNHVEPVLTKMGCNSGACHGAAAGKGGLKLTLRGYDPETDYAVLTRQAGGRRVSLVEPARSLMLRKPTAAVSHGGGQRFPVDSPEYRVLAAWIAAGAPPPRSSDPTMVGLEVFPRQAMLRPGDTQQLLVRARFSDGHREDVTRWVKFGTSDSGVATIGDDGRVSVQGPGEAAMTVWYLSQVTLARVISPFPDAPASPLTPSSERREREGERERERTGSAQPKAGIEHPRSNLIDTLVLKKLRELNIPPSGPCTDAEFIRRAYLDAAGILPKQAEVEQFLGSGVQAFRSSGVQGGIPRLLNVQDRDHPFGAVPVAAVPSERMNADRAQLIDTLLERPEFVDYWTYKWCDLLLVSSKELPSRSMRAFYQWIRRSVAENKPWDRMVRELVTASGSTLENGAANYFVLHRDPIDLTETTTQAFLGLSLTCARCHNHPMEKWTQNQYYAMANLFARVARKNGDAGEAVIYTASAGDVRHPRTGHVLPPQPLDGQALAPDAAGDRRQHLAAWLTSSRNPYFARAIVNRVWRQFMGRGLVEPEDDLRLTNPPSNEELLSALTASFVRHGFDVKWLIRAIMNSDTYQRSSSPVPGNEADQRYHSHYIVRRLPAEVILDALSQVTGVPTEFQGYPKGWRALQLLDSRVDSYFLTAFGRPERVTTCSCERQQEPSVAQALHLSNGDTVNRKLQSEDSILTKLVAEGALDEQVVRRLYLSALCRLPTEAERHAVLPALAAAPAGGDDAAKKARRQALEDLFWAVLTGREFLFNH